MLIGVKRYVSSTVPPCLRKIRHSLDKGLTHLTRRVLPALKRRYRQNLATAAFQHGGSLSVETLVRGFSFNVFIVLIQLIYHSKALLSTKKALEKTHGFLTDKRVEFAVYPIIFLTGAWPGFKI